MPLGIAPTALPVPVSHWLPSSNFFQVSRPASTAFTEDFASLSCLHSQGLQHLGGWSSVHPSVTPSQKETLELSITRNAVSPKSELKASRSAQHLLYLQFSLAQCPLVMTSELPIPPSHSLLTIHQTTMLSLASWPNYTPWVLSLTPATLPRSSAVMLRSLKHSLFSHLRNPSPPSFSHPSQLSTWPHTSLRKLKPKAWTPSSFYHQICAALHETLPLLLWVKRGRRNSLLAKASLPPVV